MNTINPRLNEKLTAFYSGVDEGHSEVLGFVQEVLNKLDNNEYNYVSAIEEFRNIIELNKDKLV